MKIRQGFVSNSSSSSFMIHRKHLTRDQDEMIQWVCPEDGPSPSGWKGHYTYGTIIGITSMDNFDMPLFFEKIRINSKKVHWGSHTCPKWTYDDIDMMLEGGEKYHKVNKKLADILYEMDEQSKEYMGEYGFHSADDYINNVNEENKKLRKLIKDLKNLKK